MISYKRDKYGVGTIVLDMDGRKVNIMNHEVAKVWTPLLDFLEQSVQKGELKGIIIASAKPSFMAGGDLDYLHQASDAQEVFEHTQTLRQIFRRIETMGVPFVAVINGTALGSGYELALACHHRIALDNSRTLIGLPEVTLGMIPVGGAIARLTRTLGFKSAFDILSKGKQMHVKEALQKGLIDELVTEKEDLLHRAKDWILSNPSATKFWDIPTYSIPKSQDPTHLPTAKSIAVLNAKIVQKTRNNYPAIQAIFNAMIEGSYLGFDAATRIESRYFTSLILSKKCLNMTKAYWYDLNKIKQGISRPKGYGRFKARKIAVIGAGKMGSGIAYVAALQGIQVLLKDISNSIAQQGKEMVRQRLFRIIKANKMTLAQSEEILDRIVPTQKIELVSDCDLVIETVFESESLKKRITKETEIHMHSDAFLATNTSTLGISNLATASSQSQNYVGLHFFSPVTRIPLVEVVRGEKTSDETVARAFDFVRQLKKTPIIIADSLAFYTTRISRVYMLEAFGMLLEGQSPVSIEQAALQAGMVYSPLVLADALGLPSILALEAKVVQLFGESYKKLKGVKLVEQMVNEFGRKGKSHGAGFYDYKNKKKRIEIWEDWKEHFPHNPKQIPQNTIMERLLFVQCLEAVRCIDNGTIKTSAEANLGSIYGAGFADFKGGALQYINDYGVVEFTTRAKELAKLYGFNFNPPASLVEMAEKQVNFS